MLRYLYINTLSKLSLSKPISNYISSFLTFSHIYFLFFPLTDDLLTHTESRNGVILTRIVESLAEVKFDPGFRVIGEYLSQITRNPGSNFSSQVTQLFRSKWLIFFFQWQLVAQIISQPKSSDKLNRLLGKQIELLIFLHFAFFYNFNWILIRTRQLQRRGNPLHSIRLCFH